MLRVISENKDRIRELCRTHGIKSLYLFGSAATRDRVAKDSDIDLLVSFTSMNHGDYADNFFDVAEEFENLFKKPVDLVTEKTLSNSYFIESVNRTKTLLYES